MSAVKSCKQCGCNEIDTDPARGDAVCTNCGTVLEESIIVSEVTFEEDGHGGASAVGQFVSAESRGGGGTLSGPAGAFHTSVGKDSREVTLRNAKKKINEVAQQLRLNQHCLDVAFNFFKMALHKQLTKGRKHSLTICACIYMTCRIEGTPHLLIDFSDVLQIDVYALGRAYVQISRALYINIPAVDPCMYILRFAHKFDLGDKTHDVAMTALRLVQRMKRDWIHLGRRPSGLCGAALLISARLHNFSRSVHDVIRVVKVHETTLRKRLVEFGETPSSSLTLDEFMSVDLEEEHDPPSYKAARIKDRERLQKLLDTDVSEELKQLQTKIDEELERRRKKILSKSAVSPAPSTSSTSSDPSRSPSKESEIENNFIIESTLETINTLISDTKIDGPKGKRVNRRKSEERDRMLMPPPSTISLSHTEAQSTLQIDPCTTVVPYNNNEGIVEVSSVEGGELDLEGIDDEEINGYIMANHEVENKKRIWEKLNEDYIIAQQLKQEQLERDIKEGKVEKKKKATKPKSTFQAKSANEAIKIMLKERKISNKINYEVLRSLTAGPDVQDDVTAPVVSQNAASAISEPPTVVIESGPVIPPLHKRKAERSQGGPLSKKFKGKVVPPSQKIERKLDEPLALPIKLKPSQSTIETTSEFDEDNVKGTPQDVHEDAVVVESGSIKYIEEDGDGEGDDEEDLDAEDEEEEEKEHELSARKLLASFRGDNADENEEDYYD